MLDFNTFFVIAVVIMLGLSLIFTALTWLDCHLFKRGCTERRSQGAFGWHRDDDSA